MQLLVSTDMSQKIPYPYDDAAIGYWIELATMRGYQRVTTIDDPEAFHDLKGRGGYNEAEATNASICLHHVHPGDMLSLSAIFD